MLRRSIAQGYGRFLEAPVPVVLMVLWVTGAVLEVLCVAALYSLYWNGLVLAQVLGENL
jgi:hypothetical protein